LAVGYLPEAPNFYRFLSGRELVTFYGRICGLQGATLAARVAEVIAWVGLAEAANRRVGTYSKGMLQRIGLAQALVHDPQLVILDEPTAGVDIEIRRSMWDFLRELNEQGITIILTTHYLEEAENLCRNIAIIDRGRIAEADRMDSLLRRLHVETLVLSLRAPIAMTPQIAGYEFQLADPQTLEVEVGKDQDLNGLFASLSAEGVQVVSMRNKVNRLEEIFMRLVDRSGAAP
jgi:ABC-2 type transport system ATP-binding protein